MTPSAPKFFGVSPAIWSKQLTKLGISLGWEPVVLYFYLLTSPHRTSEGLFRLPLAYIDGDLGIPPNRTKIHLHALEEARYLYWDEENDLILDRNALWVNPCRGEKRVPSAIKKLRGLPISSPLFHKFWLLANAHAEELARALEEEFPGIEKEASSQVNTVWPSVSDPSTETVSSPRIDTADTDKASAKEEVYTSPVVSVKEAFEAEDVSVNGRGTWS